MPNWHITVSLEFQVLESWNVSNLYGYGSFMCNKKHFLCKFQTGRPFEMYRIWASYTYMKFPQEQTNPRNQLESFYQVAAPNTASYIYAAPGPPMVSAPNNSEGLQYQIYPQPAAPPSDMYYAAAPMYPTTMLVNYDPAYYPYSVESTASSTSTGVDVSSSSNYSEVREK